MRKKLEILISMMGVKRTAQFLGVSKKSVHSWRTGKSDMKASAFEKMIKAIDKLKILKGIEDEN